MSSCLGSIRSLSPSALSCLLAAVFLSQRCFLSSVPRRHSYVVLVCLEFPPCSLLKPLLCWLLLQGPLVPMRHHFWLPLLVVCVAHQVVGLPLSWWGCTCPHICQRPGHGHPETNCYKMLDMGRAPSTGTPSPPSSPSLSLCDIVMLKHILAASGSSSIGAVGSVTYVYRTE
jgi:hypothetical protein